jgi:hypothetical protein
VVDFPALDVYAALINKRKLLRYLLIVINGEDYWCLVFWVGSGDKNSLGH